MIANITHNKPNLLPCILIISLLVKDIAPVQAMNAILYKKFQPKNGATAGILNIFSILPVFGDFLCAILLLKEPA
jgi:hypothetical protein